MLQEKTYEKKIMKYGWEALLGLWEAVKEGKTPGWKAGKAFEYLVIRAFQLDKADVRYPYSVRLDGDELEQIDGVVYYDGIACLIECKDQNTSINIEPIAKLRNQLLRRPGQVIGCVFSREGFTAPAVTLAMFTAPQTILLWTGEEIDYCLRKHFICRALISKYRNCIEKGLRDYNITVEDIP
ncbi:MAG: restriction endonuclease [Acidobacteriota bacterium]